MNKISFYITALLLFAMERAAAQNTISGTIQNKFEEKPLQADIKLTNKSTQEEYTTKSNIITGNFSLNVPNGTYILEAVPNFHYIYRDTNFVVNDNKNLDLRMIRGQNEDTTNYLISNHSYFNGSFLKFAKRMLERLDGDPNHEAWHWYKDEVPIFISNLDSASKANLYTVLTVLHEGAPNRSHKEISADSNVGISYYGVPAGHPKLLGGTAATYLDSVHYISMTPPYLYELVHASVYVTNDQGAVSERTHSREILRTNTILNLSPDSIHVMVSPGIISIATIAHPDEIHLAGVNQSLLTGERWPNYKDTIGTITESLGITYNQDWNMISIPTKENDMQVTTIFPEAISNAFKYEGSYTLVDTLENGKGYWIKLSEIIEKQYPSTRTKEDTIETTTGWNMIGSIGYLVPIDSIEQNPTGILISNYFGYNGTGYTETDTLEPGKAYWIKTNQEGTLTIKKPGTGARAEYLAKPTRNDNDIPQAPGKEKGIEAKLAYPRAFTLSQNYPNPFNPATNISFSLPSKSFVSLKIFDVLGREVTTLVNGIQVAGRYTISWNAGNNPSGVYYLQFRTSSYFGTQKLLYIK